MALLLVPFATKVVVTRRIRVTSSSTVEFNENATFKPPPTEVRSSSTSVGSSYDRSPVPPKSTKNKRQKWTPELMEADRMASRIQKFIQHRLSCFSVEEIMSNWNDPISSRALVAVLNNFSDDWKTGLAFFEWAKSREDLCDLTKFGYNVMLKLFRNGQKWEESVKLVEEMISRNIIPDSYSFTMFISCAKVSGHVDDAIEWFQNLKDSGIQFDDVTMSSMIDMFGRAGRTAEAIELYQKMRNRNWKPDVICFGVMANLYAKVGDYPSVKKLFVEMEELGLKPNVVLYNTLLGALNRANKMNMAREEFDEMQKRGVAPTVVTLRIMIDLFTKVGAVGDALEFYETIKSNRWKCDLGVYNTILGSFVDAGNVQSAEEVMIEMSRVGCRPDHQTYGTLMNVYATKGLVLQARDVFKKAVENRCAPTTTQYTVLIRACKLAREYDKVPGLFEEMNASGCTPDVKMNGMLLSCVTNTFISGEDRLAILECLKSANPRLYRLLSQLLHRDIPGPMEGICGEICNFIREEVMVISQKPMCNSFVDFCWARGDKEAAFKILEAGISAGFYRGLVTNLPSVWQLNLRTLSFSTAECALESWLGRLRMAVENGDRLPDDLMIETGTGRAKEAINSTRLADVVQQVLGATNSPFILDQRTLCYFIASGDNVSGWIQSMRTQQQPERHPDENPTDSIQEDEDPNPLPDSNLQTVPA